MKSLTALAAMLLAGAALASTFTGSIAEPKGLVTSPIAQRLNAVIVPAENAYRRSPQAVAADSELAKKDIEAAINKVIGQRASLTMRIDTLETRGDKTVATGRIDITGKLIWDRDSAIEVEARRRDYEEAATTKLKPPVIRTESERLQQRVELARQVWLQAQKIANERAAQRIPDAQIEVEFTEVPAFVRQGMKASLMGWIRAITISPEVKSDIAYASVKMTLVYTGPVNAAFAAATRPATPTSRPAATTPATQTAPATQPAAAAPQ